MSVSEQQRLHLFKTLEQRLGDEDAATMMAMLPPAGSGVATKDDLVALELRVERVVAGATNRFIGWMVGAMAVQTATIGILVSLG